MTLLLHVFTVIKSVYWVHNYCFFCWDHLFFHSFEAFTAALGEQFYNSCLKIFVRKFQHLCVVIYWSSLLMQQRFSQFFMYWVILKCILNIMFISLQNSGSCFHPLKNVNVFILAAFRTFSHSWSPTMSWKSSKSLILTACLNEDNKVSPEIFGLYWDFIKFTVLKVD